MGRRGARLSGSGACRWVPELRVVALLATAVVALLSPAHSDAAPLPQVQSTCFFADGSTRSPFQTWLLLFNPAPAPAEIKVTFFGGGSTETRAFSLRPRARMSLNLNDVVPEAEFGLKVESSLPTAVERVTYFGPDGTVVKGVAAPSPGWLFAEGATDFPHETWFVVLNPNPEPASVAVEFYGEAGPLRTSHLTVPPMSRATVFANLILPPAAFSTRIAADRPVVAERAMYRADSGGGMAATGVSASSRAWYFAEGSSKAPFDTWFLVFNPNPDPVHILMRLYLDGGGPGRTLDFTVPANARFSLYANEVQPGTDFGATIVSEGGPIVAERSMFFRGASSNSPGSPALATEWFLAEGSTVFPFQEWIHLTNPGVEGDATVTIVFYLPDGATSSQTLLVRRQARASLLVNAVLPESVSSGRVTSDRPIVVERSMFFSEGRGGHNTVGISP